MFFVAFPRELGTICSVLGQSALLSQCLSHASQCDGLACHPGGSRDTPSRFLLQKSEISTSLMDYLACLQTLLLPREKIFNFNLLNWRFCQPSFSRIVAKSVKRC